LAKTDTAADIHHLDTPDTRAGTVAYMSPEQVLGEDLDSRSDLFSFGLVLYEMATGKAAFSGAKNTEISSGILRTTQSLVVEGKPDLPRSLVAVIAKCLEKNRDLRYQRASEVRTDLERIKGEQSSPACLRTSQSRDGHKLATVRIAPVAIPAAVVAGIISATLLFHPRPKLSGEDTIVIADFVNNTGDAVFDGTLRQGLAVQLEQSPLLSLISDERIRQTLRLMAQPPDARLTPELAREVCERTGSAAVLEGSIAGLGSRYVLGLRARNCRTGDMVDEEQAQAAAKDDVLNSLNRIARRFRTRLNESLATVEKHDTPLAEATTPSLEALKAYTAAIEVHNSKGSAAALPLFRRATEIDPRFAMAHAWLGRLYADINESDVSTESTRRAWEFRARASDQERFSITAAYDALVTGNMETAQQDCEAWARTYPRDARPHRLMSGMINKSRGRYEKAPAEARKAIELDPDNGIGYYNLAVNHIYLGRPQEAEDILQRAAGRGLDIDEFISLAHDIAFLRGNQAAMKRQAAVARGRSGGENWISNQEAFALAYSGHLQEARTMSRRAVDQARHAGQRERGGLWQAGAAVREAFFGNVSEAKKLAMAALELSTNREVEYGAAFALALSGDSTRSQALANDLEKRFPEDTSIQFSYLPTLRARLALNRGDAAKAFELLQAAVPNELGAPRSRLEGGFGALYPIYVRGQAYLAAHQGTAAAMEFQKIFDHTGIVVSDPVGALVRLQLGRAFALSGEKVRAKVAYTDFLTLWKEADADIPILKQAKEEYTNLRD
jgi:eukaryotic-like serine/threonine-protein kinase